MTALNWQPCAGPAEAPTDLSCDPTPDCHLRLWRDYDRQVDVLSFNLDLGQHRYRKCFTKEIQKDAPLVQSISWARERAQETLRGLSVTIQVALDRLEP